jgi:hypothetical protein
MPLFIEWQERRFSGADGSRLETVLNKVKPGRSVGMALWGSSW